MMAQSVQINNTNSIPIIKNHSIDEAGKVKIMAFDVNILEQLSLGEVLELCYLPQGKIRIIGINIFYSETIEDANLKICALDRENLAIKNLAEGFLQITNNFIAIPLNNVVISNQGITILLDGEISFDKDFSLSGYVLYVED